MAIPAIVRTLPAEQQLTLTSVVKPKFDAYVEVASAFRRSVPSGNHYIYPAGELHIDLVFFWSLFIDVSQALGGYEKLATLFKGDSYLVRNVRRIVQGESETDQDGSFWHFPKGQIQLDDSVDQELGSVLRTLRNGFAHLRWMAADKSALDYWSALGWSTSGAPADFDLLNRPAKNWTLYVADGGNWEPSNFWKISNLRIVVTHVHILRFHLHLILNYILNGEQKDVFGNVMGPF